MVCSKKRIICGTILAAVSFCALSGASAESSSAEKPLRVLMIGNSFSLSNIRQMPQIAASMGLSLDLASLHIGGCSLERHWNNVLAASTNATFRPCSFNRNRSG